MEEAIKISSDTIRNIIEKLNHSILFLSAEYKVDKSPFYNPYYLVNDRLLVHKDNLNHTILLRSFELNTIKSFTSLFTDLYHSYNKNDSLYEEFSFRTLHDISFKKLAILYSKEIKNQDKEKFKIISIFDDFFFVYQTFPQWLNAHKKLLNEKGSLFEKDERSKIDKALDLIDNDVDKSNKLIRKLLLDIEYLLMKSVSTPVEFDDNKLKSLYSGYSKLLHGDIPFLMDLFSRENSKRLIYRKTYFLLSSGLNALMLISKTYPELNIDTKSIHENYKQVCLLMYDISN